MQAYLLAAGDGKRAGGPKAWLDFHGQPLLERQLDFVLSRFPAKNVAVSIQKGWQPRCEALSKDVAWAAVDPKASPLASLQALLRARPTSSPFFVWHVDQPVWDHGLFDALASRIPTMVDHSLDTAPEAVRPVFEGSRGHPVLLSHELGFKILALNPVSERLDEFLRTRRIEDVAVDSARCLDNWNEGVPA